MSIAKKIKEIKKIKVEPGEVLLVQYDGMKVTSREVQSIHNAFLDVFPSNDVLLHSMDLEIKSIDHAEAQKVRAAIDAQESP